MQMAAAMAQAMQVGGGGSSVGWRHCTCVLCSLLLAHSVRPPGCSYSNGLPAPFAPNAILIPRRLVPLYLSCPPLQVNPGAMLGAGLGIPALDAKPLDGTDPEAVAAAAAAAAAVAATGVDPTGVQAAQGVEAA